VKLPCATEFRHVVAIQRRDETTDNIGGQTLVWTTVMSPWCKIEPLSASQRQFAGKTQAEVTHKVTMRYAAGVTAKHRILWGTRVFEISGVRNIEESNALLELSCVEGAGT
jgi:SPP1 family predicted phage head-tail adaptor